MSLRFGESLQRPSYRIVPLRDAPYTRLVQAVLKGRAEKLDPSTESACLNSGDVAILLDGGNKGNKARLLQPWKLGVQDAAKKKNVSEADDGEAVVAEDMDDQEGPDVPAPGFVPTLLTLGYTEESVTQNRRRNQFQTGLARVPQSEWVHIVSDRKICLPSRKRMHFPGTTVGDLLSGLEVPAIEAEWHMPWGEKKAYYGKKLLVAVGGKTDVAPEDKEKAIKTDKSMVPTVHHLMPGNFYEEMVHTFFAKCVIDLTPLSGKFAWTALKAKVAYVGIVPTAAASAALKARLTSLLKEELATPGSKLYSTEYAEAIGGKTQKDCDKDKKEAKTVPKAKSKKTKLADAPATVPKKKAKKDSTTPKKEDQEEADDNDDGFNEGTDSADSEVWDPLADDPAIE